MPPRTDPPSARRRPRGVARLSAPLLPIEGLAESLEPPEIIAAIDLGSNSFHLVTARVVQGGLLVIDKMRDTVRLAAGLDDHDRLHGDSEARALACLERFGQLVREMPRRGVRAVGTSTLRRATNSADFLAKARNALGHPIEIVSGREEARLIYLGLTHSVASVPGRRLVIDIGGASTECILGERFEPLLADSLDMGCVTWMRHFPKGEIRKDGFKHAELAASRQLEPLRRGYTTLGWDACAGGSGTIGATQAILRALEGHRGGITRDGLERLKKELLAFGHIKHIQLPDLRADRAEVLPAGVAILTAVFDAFGIEQMEAASGALREGVLHDLLGRIRHDDVRDRTVSRLAERYHVDAEQAARVERTVRVLQRKVADSWKIDDVAARQALTWAARLHEIGLMVAFSGYHRHGAYLVANADMPGFSRDDQELVASLIRMHRRKLALGKEAAKPGETVIRMAVLLRLAVLLNRARSHKPLPPFGIDAVGDKVVLSFPADWLADQPLTAADLAQEALDLKDAGIALEVTRSRTRPAAG